MLVKKCFLTSSCVEEREGKGRNERFPKKKNEPDEKGGVYIDKNHNRKR